MKRAEHPPVQAKVAKVAADHRQDGGNGQRFEGHQRDRQHQPHRQGAAAPAPRHRLARPARPARPSRGGQTGACSLKRGYDLDRT